MKVSRVHRLLKLITLLQTGKPYRVADMSRECKVSRRTLFRDLNLLKLAGVPIVFDVVADRYAIEKKFFLPPVNFTVGEALSLMMAIQKCSPRNLIPNPEVAVSALIKLESILPQEIQTYCGSAMNHIEFRHGPVTEAERTGKIFDLLWRAAQEHETVNIVYDSYFEQKEIGTRLDPYRLIFISRGWYVIGYSHQHKQTRTFKIERIIEVNPSKRKFSGHESFSTTEYFGNAWQMIRGAKWYHVRIRFSPKVSGNVEEVLWHPTQQTQRLEDGSLQFEVDVDGVEEMSWWVMGYGKEAVVEAPADLRKLIRQHSEAMVAYY